MIAFEGMRWAGFIALGIVVAACSSTSNSSSLSHAPRHGGAADDDDDDDVTALDAGPFDAGSSSPDAGDAAPPASELCKIGGLALCFPFEGAATDGSPNALVPKIANISFVAGKDGLAASFGAGSQMTFEPNSAFDLPADAATIEAWIKRQSTGADAVVFDDDGRFSLTIDAGGKVLCKSSGGAVTGQTAIAADDWAHVACVIDQGAIKAYVNGKEDGAGTGSISPNPELAAAIGQNSPDGEPFLGLIDSFRVLSVARTGAELAADAAK